MIMKLLELRTILLKAYQKTRFIINPLVKFIIAWIVFTGINKEIGFDARLTGSLVVFLISAICAVTPSGIMVLLAMVVTLLHLFNVSLFLAAFMLVVFIILYALLIRFTPKQAIVAVLIPILGRYNLHYAVPLVLGATATPVTMLATATGVILYYLMDIVKIAAERKIDLKLDDILQLYTDIADAILANKQMMISIIVFAVVIIVVFIIRQLSFNYSFALSLVLGGVANIIGFLIADLFYDATVNVGTLIFMTIVSTLLAFVVEYFKRVLDYTSVEHVQFEDDDYYYFVKAVPKVNVSIPRHNVKRYNDEDEEADSENDGGENYSYNPSEDYTEDSYSYADESGDDGYRHNLSDDLDDMPDADYEADYNPEGDLKKTKLISLRFENDHDPDAVYEDFDDPDDDPSDFGADKQ